MTNIATPFPEDNDEKRILKWSSFYDPKSTEGITLEEQFQLRRILGDIRKPFSQAEDLATSNRERQINSDLLQFVEEVISSLYCLNKGREKALKQITESLLEDSKPKFDK